MRHTVAKGNYDFRVVSDNNHAEIVATESAYSKERGVYDLTRTLQQVWPDQLTEGQVATTSLDVEGEDQYSVKVLTTKGCVYVSHLYPNTAYLSVGQASSQFLEASKFVKIANCIPVESTYVEKAVPGSMHVLTNKSLWYQGNDSSAWAVDSSGLNGDQPLDIARDSSDNFYAVGNGGIFTQSAPFTSWTMLKSSNQFNQIHSVFFDRRDRMFIANDTGHVWWSSDRGTSWNKLNPVQGWVFPRANTYLADDAFGNIYMYSGSGGTHIYRSPGGTSDWVDITTPLVTFLGSPASLNSITGDTLLYAATSFGVLQSSDQGGTWSFSNVQMPAANYYGFAKTSTGRLLGSTDLGVFRNDPATQQWAMTYPTSGFTKGALISQSRTGGLYLLDSHGINGSSDGGAHWFLVDTQIKNITSFYMDETGTGHISAKGILYAGKPGQSWQVDTDGMILGRYT